MLLCLEAVRASAGQVVVEMNCASGVYIVNANGRLQGRIVGYGRISPADRLVPLKTI